VRLSDVRALQALGTQHAAPYAEAIVGRLWDEDWRVGDAVVAALGTLGAHAAPHAEAIVGRLDDATWEVRRSAVRALQALGAQHAAPYAEAIVGRLWDGDSDVSDAAVAALGTLGAHAAPLETFALFLVLLRRARRASRRRERV
jgi:HEAT repeat protein